jgi:purine-binding chemotaxis protein CheW
LRGRKEQVRTMSTVGNPRTERRAGTKARLSPTRHRRIVVFHLGGQAYGLPLREIQEIVPMAALSSPPGLPSVLAGFLNLAGTAIPVVRLDRLFEVPPLTPGRYTPLLILRNPDCRVALLVEKVRRILDVAEETVVPVGENQSFNDAVEGVVTLDEHVLLLLSAERILLEKEYQCLAEFQDREQARLRALEGTSP